MKPLNSDNPLPQKLANLREIVEARYGKWKQDHCEPLDRFEDFKMSPLGRAARRQQRYTEMLGRDVKERCAIQRAVSLEYSVPEMLSGTELDWLAGRMMTVLSFAVLTLKEINERDFFSVGSVSPSSSKAVQERVEYHLPTEIRSVINAEVRVLRAEGEAAKVEDHQAGDRANVPHRRRRGPVANMKRHEEIGTIVKSYANPWTEENLSAICDQLDDNKTAPPAAWKSLKPRACSWRRGYDSYPERARKVLQYSLTILDQPTATPNRRR